MGEFDGGAKCPKCGTWGAQKSLWKVKCVNPSCEKYNPEYAEGFRQSRVTGKPASEVFPKLQGKADPNDYSFQIRYQNFRERTHLLRKPKNHLPTRPIRRGAAFPYGKASFLQTRPDPKP